MQITVNNIRRILCVSFMALVFGANVIADTSEDSAQCRILDRSDAVIIMVCSTKEPEAWQQAGKEACGLKQLCNAWIWNDKTKAPRVAPLTDADMPKVNSSQAVAIWVNDSKMLMTLRQVK